MSYETSTKTSLSSRLGYIHEDHLLKTISDARSGKVAPIVRVLWTISLEYWLRDLTARGLLDPPAASSSLFGQQQVGFECGAVFRFCP